MVDKLSLSLMLILRGTEAITDSTKLLLEWKALLELDLR